MNLLLLNIFLALAWAAINGRFDPPNLVLGFVLGYLILWLSRRAFRPSTYFAKVPQVLRFILFILWELLLANLRVARLVLSPLDRLRPRVIGVPVETNNEIELTVIANLVSLTPGTFSLEASQDRRMLYVHTLYAPDPELHRQSIKDGFERPILALLRDRVPGGGPLEEGKDGVG